VIGIMAIVKHHRMRLADFLFSSGFLNMGVKSIISMRILIAEILDSVKIIIVTNIIKRA
jgi:hypothetical protein